MLQFYYDLMDPHGSRLYFQYCKIDTGSADMSISGETIEMMANYKQGVYGFCSYTNIEADGQFQWFPRQCYEKHQRFDKRSPDLFKLDF